MIDLTLAQPRTVGKFVDDHSVLLCLSCLGGVMRVLTILSVRFVNCGAGWNGASALTRLFRDSSRVSQPTVAMISDVKNLLLIANLSILPNLSWQSDDDISMLPHCPKILKLALFRT